VPAGVDELEAAPELVAMLAVSRLVAHGGPLPEILDGIAAEAAGVVEAQSASILLLAGDRFTLAGSYGLSPSYAALLDRAPALAPGHGPSGLAVEREHAVAIPDTELDAEFAPWRPLARTEGYRAMVSAPLFSEGEVVGALNVYRPRPGPWAERDLALLGFFSEHAASAIRAAQVIERQARQVGALSRLVRALREQTHEHANRLHAIRGLLALGAPEDALAFVETLETAHHSAYGTVSGAVEHPVVAGLLLAELAAAERRGIALKLEDAHVRTLPDRLTEADAVTILGNLLENAFDAVAELEPARRRVRLSIAARAGALRIGVADRGPGLPEHVLERGVTTKLGHAGVGLALVGDAVAAAGGTIETASDPNGTAFTVTIPYGPVAAGAGRG
jgi:GAF domain-containing protein/anti-sigma regulatory factor (Ser/Thr protein kinase)